MLSDTIVPADMGDAEGLAKLILADLLKLMPMEELKTRLTAMAFDGQYICEDVPGELRALLDSKLSADWLTGMWDGAHLVELGLNDVRLDKTGTINAAHRRVVRAAVRGHLLAGQPVPVRQGLPGGARHRRRHEHPAARPCEILRHALRGFGAESAAKPGAQLRGVRPFLRGGVHHPGRRHQGQGHGAQRGRAREARPAASAA
jgi:hypothetical protein